MKRLYKNRWAWLTIILCLAIITPIIISKDRCKIDKKTGRLLCTENLLEGWFYGDVIGLLLFDSEDSEQIAQSIANEIQAEIVLSVPSVNVYNLKLSVQTYKEREFIINRFENDQRIEYVFSAPTPISLN